MTSFYDGFFATEELLVSNLEVATTANLVGKKTIQIAIKAGYIDKEGVIKIGGVPHAQMYRI
ncbi:MAG: DUF424 family protein [Methanobacteriota archaeon]|nr:MAG: DUF424 family protein [Euryarchaeota archaeon]